MLQIEITQLIKPLIEEAGYELWGCEYLSQGRHSLLRVYIDKEGGVGLDDCELVSKQVSTCLDVEDLIPGFYHLEISSPGIPRPLFYKEQYKRYIGHEVQLKLFKPLAGKRRLLGTIMAVDEEQLLLKVGDEQLELKLPQIVKANLIGE